jgi:CRP-like cAMP-binding protein
MPKIPGRPTRAGGAVRERGRYDLLALETTTLSWRSRDSGNRQKQLEKRLVDLAHKKAPQRLADLLVQLGQSYGVRDARGTLLRIQLSQSALGNLQRLSREIVNHAVSDLRRRGVIDFSRTGLGRSSPRGRHRPPRR